MKKSLNTSFSGLLLVDKPQGFTSHDVVGKLRRLLKTRSVGHAGTLDPMATGLLICMVGKATKLSQWLTQDSKVYEGALSLGSQTSTGDAEGEVIQKFSKDTASRDEVLKVFESLLGEQVLEVPRYSAIKVQGKKLYELSREGKDFSPPQRPMNFYSIQLKGLDGNKILFSVSCSKGTYIRSFAEEVARRLGTGAHLSMLRRISSGAWSLESAETLDSFEFYKEKTESETYAGLLKRKSFVELSKVFKRTSILRLSTKEEKLFLNGQNPYTLQARIRPFIRSAQNEEVSKHISILSSQGELKALLKANPEGQVQTLRFF